MIPTDLLATKTDSRAYAAVSLKAVASATLQQFSNMHRTHPIFVRAMQRQERCSAVAHRLRNANSKDSARRIRIALLAVGAGVRQRQAGGQHAERRCGDPRLQWHSVQCQVGVSGRVCRRAFPAARLASPSASDDSSAATSPATAQPAGGRTLTIASTT